MNAQGAVGVQGFTPSYLDPSAPISGVMTGASDVYSVGFVLFEMLSGPFDWTKLDPAKAQAKLLAGRRPMPASWLTFAPHVQIGYDEWSTRPFVRTWEEGSVPPPTWLRSCPVFVRSTGSM